MKLGIKGFLGLLVLLNVGWQCQAAGKLNFDEIAQAFAYREDDSDLMKALYKTEEECKKQSDKLPAEYSFEDDMKVVVRCGDGNPPLLEALKKYEFLTEAIQQAQIPPAEQERARAEQERARAEQERARAEQERARIERLKLSILQSYDYKGLADLSLNEIWAKIIYAQFYLKNTRVAALLTQDEWLECERRAIGEFDDRCNGIPRTHGEREMIANKLEEQIARAMRNDNRAATGRPHGHHRPAVIDEKSLLKGVLDEAIKQAQISPAEQERARAEQERARAEQERARAEQERARIERMKLSILRSYDDKGLAGLSLQEIWSKIINAQLYLKHTGDSALTQNEWSECEMRAIGAFDARCNGIPRTHEEREMIVSKFEKKIADAMYAHFMATRGGHYRSVVIDEKSLLKGVLDEFITARDKIRKR